MSQEKLPENPVYACLERVGRARPGCRTQERRKKNIVERLEDVHFGGLIIRRELLGVVGELEVKPLQEIVAAFMKSRMANTSEEARDLLQQVIETGIPFSQSHYVSITKTFNDPTKDAYTVKVCKYA